MHFYESSIITTKDGLHCQAYGNEHPVEGVLIKPKYIPTDRVFSIVLPSRFISGKKMNRLNLWVDKEGLKNYIGEFKKEYPEYIYKSRVHKGDRLFFIAPIDKIERVYFPKTGLAELMKMPSKSLDPHLKTCYDFVNFLLESGLKLGDLGITYSTLMGHYFSKISDINIVVYGKKNFWNLMDYLKKAKHPLLRWKTKEEWLDFHKRRNRFAIFDKEQFLFDMMKKKSEGFFNDNLFVIFSAEKEDEVWFKWGEEEYTSLGLVKIEGIVSDNFDSVVRPGCYKIKNSKIIEGYEDVKVDKIVFYSRDYCMLAEPNEKIEACGILENVYTKNGDSYHRVVVGYFDAYISDRREKEYIKTISNKKLKIKSESEEQLFNKFASGHCVLCKEANLKVGEKTSYGACIIYKIGDSGNGWFAALSPRTGGDPKKDFSIQLVPMAHLTNFSQINDNPDLAKNYGIAFGKISAAVRNIIESQGEADKIPIGTYGKCKYADEHIHVKIFPWRNDIGQPFTVDSSYQRKEIHTDTNGGKFVKMKPVRKVDIEPSKFENLSNKFISLLK